MFNQITHLALCHKYSEKYFFKQGRPKMSASWLISRQIYIRMSCWMKRPLSRSLLFHALLFRGAVEEKGLLGGVQPAPWPGIPATFSAPGPTTRDLDPQVASGQAWVGGRGPVCALSLRACNDFSTSSVWPVPEGLWRMYLFNSFVSQNQKQMETLNKCILNYSLISVCCLHRGFCRPGTRRRALGGGLGVGLWEEEDKKEG